MFDLQASRFVESDDEHGEEVVYDVARACEPTCRPALRSLWRSLQLGYRAEPRLLLVVVRA